MRIGYECMLTGHHETGVGGSIRALLCAVTQLLDGDSLVVFTHRDASETLPTHERTAIVNCALPAWGRTSRIVWQQAILPATLQRHSIDVYHGPGYVVPAGLPVPAVVSVYDTIALEHTALTSRRNAWHYRWAIPRAVRSARRVMVPSDYVRRRLIAITGVEGKRVVVTPLGVAPEFRPIPQDEAARLLLAVGLDDAPFLLCVGNIESKKNLTAALHAFEEWRRTRAGAKLVLVGNPGNARLTVQRQIAARGLMRCVILPGYVPRCALVALYNRATALLYPSHEEGFGLPPLEAMACGTPAVVSNAGALPETAGAAALLVSPEDYSGWARSAVRVTEETNLREELRGRGLMHAARFSWSRTAAEVLAVYRAAACEPREARRAVSRTAS